MIALLSIIGPCFMVLGYVLVISAFSHPSAHFRNRWNEDQHEIE